MRIFGEEFSFNLKKRDVIFKCLVKTERKGATNKSARAQLHRERFSDSVYAIKFRPPKSDKMHKRVINLAHSYVQAYMVSDIDSLKDRGARFPPKFTICQANQGQECILPWRSVTARYVKHIINNTIVEQQRNPS